MQIDIAAHIEKLLFLHDSLAIPSLGTFTATRTAATADYVGGAIAPPSKTLTFSDNLLIDDGLLVEDIAQTHQVAHEEARKAVDAFVENVQALLNQREIVTLPGVGRMYKNYMQKIQFLPDATNFYIQSYGLQPLQFNPLSRSRETPEPTPAPETPAATPPAPEAKPTPAVPPVAAPTEPIPSYTPPRSGVSAAWVAVLGFLMLAALVFGLWWMRNRKAAKPAETPAKQEVVQQDEEPAPTEKNKPAPVTPPKEEKAEPAKSEEATAAEAANQRLNEARRQINTAPGSRECVLVVATLQEKTNAERLEATLRNAGYEVYSVQKSGYQIGIQFSYRNISEVQEKIVALQKLTGEDQIWIKKK